VETVAEKAVRKLLVASQKGGVGKTTTSINLAAATAMAGARVLLLDADPLSSISASLNLTEHPRRRPLRSDGIDLPGVLVCDVVPGLDVLSPYEEGGCSDNEFEELLRLVASPCLGDGYGALIVDAPPFLGANPAQLLQTADEFVLVMRAEPTAYRTLPAFLELVQRSRKDDHTIQMRGILLTLPENESPGGRWERELRGRFGARILPQVIPFDEEVGKALACGKIAAHSASDSPAAGHYHLLVGILELAADAHLGPAQAGAASPLLAAAAPQFAGVAASAPGRTHDSAAADVLPSDPVADERAELDQFSQPRPANPSEPELSDFLHAAPELPPDEQSAGSVTGMGTELPTLSDLVLGPSSLSAGRIPILPPVPEDEIEPPTPPRAAPPPSPSVAPTPLTPKPSAPSPLLTPARTLLLAVGLAVVLAIGLRFFKLPEYVLPVAVGLAVAGGVVLALRLNLSARTGAPTTPSPTVKKLPVPARGAKEKRDANARLAALARQGPRSPSRRGDE
jgi:chromosome partitioning protein